MKGRTKDVDFQVVKDGANRWLVWKLEPVKKYGTALSRGYEEYARIVCVGDLYYVETPEWGPTGITKWERQPRPWMTKEGAENSIMNPKIGAVA